MDCALKRFSYLFLLSILVAACQKDVKKTILPNDLVETQPAIQTPVTVKVNDAIGGFYSAVPAHYAETTKNYPLLVFITVGGQLGNGAVDLPYVLNDGVAQLLDEKKFPPHFNVNGKN